MNCPSCNQPADRDDLLCAACKNTIHDPDVTVGRDNLERILANDHAYAEANQLRLGDFTDTDGTITRAIDEDDYVARLRASIARPIEKLVR